MHPEAWFEQLPFWQKLTTAEKQLVRDNAFTREFKSKNLIQSSDSLCLGLAYFLSGSARVYVTSDEGREITLFYLNKDDTCLLTASSILSYIDFDTLIVAREDVSLLVVPAAIVSTLLENNLHMKCFAYELIAKRFSTVMWVMQQIVFTRFDKRLASFLLEERQKAGSNDILLKQEQIARRINSSRVVVARMLRQFAGDGLVVCRRGCISLKNTSWLEKIAGATATGPSR